MTFFRVVILFFFFFSVFSLTANSVDAKKLERPYSLVISGGISLGAYEAGVNWVIIDYLRRKRENPYFLIPEGENTVKQDHIHPPTLASMAGASAGSINVLLSAIAWCRADSKLPQDVSSFNDSLEDNVIRNAWKDITFNSMLPDAELCERKPNKDESWNQPDALLCRKAIYDQVRKVKDILTYSAFRPNCKLPIGLTVTSEKPRVLNIGKQMVKNSRFLVPMEFVTGKAENNQNYVIGAKLVESELVSENKNEHLNIIRLPYAINGSRAEKELDLDAALASIMASSAFPIAFGRIELQHCIKQQDVFETWDETDSDVCPLNYTLKKENFVDGGVFDNIPLGLAKMLGEKRKNPYATNQKHVYMFMDPDRRRNKNSFPSKPGSNKCKTASYGENRLFGLREQGAFLGGAINSGRAYELYATLKNEGFDTTDQRELFFTDRFHPITGTTISNFGAFLSSKFNEFDYYAGVYDGIVSMSKHDMDSMYSGDMHNLENQSDDSYLNLWKKITKDYEDLLFKNSGSEGKLVFDHIYGMEFDKDAPDQDNLNLPILDIAKSVNVLNDDSLSACRTTPGKKKKKMSDSCDQENHKQELKDPEFSQFIRALTKTLSNNSNRSICEVKLDSTIIDLLRRDFKQKQDEQGEKQNDLLVRLAENPTEWFPILLKRVSSKMVSLEKCRDERCDKLDNNEKDEEQSSILKYVTAGAFLSHTIYKERKTTFSPTVAPIGRKCILTSCISLIPYELFVDARHGGVSVSWNPTFRFDWLDSIAPEGTLLDLRITPYQRPSRDNKAVHFGSTALTLDFPIDNVFFSSVGVGPAVHKDWSNRFGDNVTWGVAGHFSLFGDIMRLSGAYRLDYPGKRGHVMLGIRDIPALVNGIGEWYCNRF
ncbi:MAG: patatin-like phospholipase family protein [Magnetococcales bacterium]|nr:patatin-like phospholipase family protein [Magnetococcales bacterium]